MNSGVYLIECNGVKYVGQAKDIEKRFKEHMAGLKNKKHFNDYMQRLYNKYPRNFIFSVIEECQIEQLNDREIFWINKLNTLSPNGMNLIQGGNVKTPSLETRKKISDSNKGKPARNKGIPRTKETKLKISISKKGNFLLVKRKNKSSNYYGVYLTNIRNNSYWKARIKVDGNLISIGYFKVEVEAAVAYNNYIIQNGLSHPLNEVIQ